MNRIHHQRHQAGAALLAFLLVMLAGASYVLVTKLNANVRQYTRQAASSGPLSEAKAALIGYALTYPENVNPAEGPGYLPCPDISNDGIAGGSCSLAGGTTVGRLPWKTLEINELRDHAGERLWYAVADNYKNNPKVLDHLNSNAPGNFSVNARDDIVAVIFAPGAILDGQDRTAGAARLQVGNYLEADNADGDTGFVSRAAAGFNDQVVIITRDELMSVMERRVASEVRTAFNNYYSNYSAYPWLAPFADPKARLIRLSGSHTGSNNSPDLVEAGRDFSAAGIQAGDVLWNRTDGAFGLVSASGSTTINTSGMSAGVDNDFDLGDQYLLFPGPGGTMDIGSSNLTLVDTEVDFDGLGVVRGDVVDNLTDGSSGVVESVTGNQLTVGSLTGGSVNVFATNNDYRIRSSLGTAGAGSSGLTLQDSDTDFTTLGIQPGALIINLGDGSWGRVESVSSNTLTVAELVLGNGNDFQVGDRYYLPRFTTDYTSREGLVSLHEQDKPFATQFSIDWDTHAANGASVMVSASNNSPHGIYTGNLSDRVQGSNGNLGTVSVSFDSGQCVWGGENQAECLGVYRDPNFPVQGTVTSGSNTSVLTDANAEFVLTAVKRGDIVRNFDDEAYTGVSGTATSGSGGEILEDTGKNFNALGIVPYFHFIHNIPDSNARGLITEIIDNNTIRVIPFGGGRPDMAMDPGDNYQIYFPEEMVVTGVNSATQLQTAPATSTAPDLDSSGAGGSGAYQEFYQIDIATGRTPTRVADGYYVNGEYLIDAGADFSEIQPGDIVENITDNAFGVVSSVDATNDYLVAYLYAADGSRRYFNAGESYRIYYDHELHSRHYEFRTRITGNVNVHDSGSTEVRKRDVCLGYDSACAAAGATVALPAMKSMLMIRDRDIYGNQLATATVDIPAAGASGSLRVANMDYHLWPATAAQVEDDVFLPLWFSRNRWHELIQVAYPDGFRPAVSSGLGSCTPGTDCLALQGRVSINNGQLSVVAAGRQLEQGTCVADGSDQDRSRGRLCDYYEDDNGDADDAFRKDNGTVTFNDKITVITP